MRICMRVSLRSRMIIYFLEQPFHRGVAVYFSQKDVIFA